MSNKFIDEEGDEFTDDDNDEFSLMGENVAMNYMNPGGWHGPYNIDFDVHAQEVVQPRVVHPRARIKKIHWLVLCRREYHFKFKIRSFKYA